MSFVRSPAEKKTSPRLAPMWKPLDKMTSEELRTELSSLDQPTTGAKAVLVERLRKFRMKQGEDEGEEPKGNPSVASGGSMQPERTSELMMLFTMMKQQLDADREAADRRFQMQLQEMRQQAKEERLQLTAFLADTAKKAEERRSSETGDTTPPPQVFLKKFNRLHSELMESLQALELKCSTSNSVEEIEVYVKTVDLAMTDLKGFIDSNIDGLEDGDLKDETIQKFTESKQVYMSQTPLAKSKLSELRALEEADKAAGSLPVGVTPPDFYGDILTFPMFWESFAPLVHDNPKVSRFYKMSYLKAAMRGSASGVLNGFPSTASNYESAVAAVMKRYGRNQAIVRNHIKDLLEGRRIESDADKVRKLLDNANAKKSVLTQHNISWDQIFTQILEAQLPVSLYERWIRKISPLVDADKAPDSKLLFEFIATELTTMESLQKDPSPRHRGKPPKSKQTIKQSAKSEQQFSAQSLVTRSSSTPCVYCGKAHVLGECESFLKLTPTQRMADLISKPGKVCFRCLAHKGLEGHPKNFYQCKARCAVKDCGKPHHELLHVSEKPNKDSKVLVSTVRRKNCPSQQFCDSEIDTILPTALASITYNGQTKRVRIAFDSFSQKSFVTKNLVDELELPSVNKEFMNISGFGGNSRSRVMDLVKFILRPSTPGRSDCIEIEAHVQDGVICSPLENIKLNPKQASRFHGLELADPVPRESGTVDVLLGGRYYFSLMQGSVVQPDVPETGPFAIETLTLS